MQCFQVGTDGSVLVRRYADRGADTFIEVDVSLPGCPVGYLQGHPGRQMTVTDVHRWREHQLLAADLMAEVGDLRLDDELFSGRVHASCHLAKLRRVRQIDTGNNARSSAAFGGFQAAVRDPVAL